MLSKVNFTDVTDAELAIAASVIRHKTVSRLIARTKFPLSKKSRKILVEALTECGYTGVMIDPSNRINSPDALVPFDVATAV